MRTIPNAILIVLLMLFVNALGMAAQQPYPTKPVRFLVGYSPGGVNDIVSRLLAPEMTLGLGQQVVVDNRAGASGVIANTIAAQSAPDGHTILLVPTSFAIDISRGARFPYDPMRDFLPVTLVATSSLVLVVNPALRINSVQDLLAIARAKPGYLSFAHAGNGNVTHIATELLKAMTGTNMIAVAYKGGGAALIDVVSGQVQFGTPTIPPALGHIRAGRLKALAVTGSRRTDVLPGVPTISEAGVPGYEASAWWAVLVPSKTPETVVMRINKEIARALSSSAITERLAGLSAEPVGNSPQELKVFLQAEVVKWEKVIKSTGLKID